MNIFHLSTLNLHRTCSLPLALLVFQLLLSSSIAQPVEQNAAPSAARTVRTVQVKAAPPASALTLPARTAPAEEAKLFTRATGVVSERPVEIGDLVKQGDVLAVVDAPEVDFELEQAAAELAQAEAKATYASADLARARVLEPTRAISAEGIDLRVANEKQSLADVRAKKAELGSLQAMRDFQTLRAPFPGMIVERQVDRGMHVRGDQSAAEQWLYHLARLDELRVEVDATADVVLRLQPGAEGIVTFPEFPSREFKAKITRVVKVVNATSGTQRIEMLLPNPDLEIPAGLSGSVRLQLPNASQVVLVPGNALQTRDGKPMVVAVENGKAKFITVKTGRNLGKEVEVMDGIQAGAVLILNPNALLRDGDAVVEDEESKAGAGPKS